jgi:hypothetical protein
MRLTHVQQLRFAHEASKNELDQGMRMNDNINSVLILDNKVNERELLP